MITHILIFLTCSSLVVCQLEVFQDYELFQQQFQKVSSNPNISSECVSQLIELFRNDTDVTTDLKRARNDFLDSTSKYPWSGVRDSQIIDWGNYDQCININYKYSNGKILGKYCVAGLILPIRGQKPEDTAVNFLALCMPDACSATDFGNITHLPLFQDQYCHTKEYTTHFTVGDWIMIFVLVGFAILMILSTTYDVCLNRKKLKTRHPLLLAFSIFTNGKKLLKTAKGNREQIQIFNGIKTISMMWVIGGHLVSSWQLVNLINAYITKTYLANLWHVYIAAAPFSVDTFFYMSGFLIAFTYLKQKGKPVKAQIIDLPLAILHRYLRLTPAVAMLYFITITIFRHVAKGPTVKIWNDELVRPCHKYWWSFFLYIQNYYNYNDKCLGHTWYLSADMQMYIYSLLLMIPLTALLASSSRNLTKVMVILGLLNLFNIVLPLTIKLVFPDYDNQYDTHSRLIDYTMGITMGVFMREHKDKAFFSGKVRKLGLVNFILWVATLGLLLGTALIFQRVIDKNSSHTAVSVMYCLTRPAWCLGLSWMVYSSYHGYGGIINWMLTRPTFQITAKLSYCMYLTHWLVLVSFLIVQRTRFWYSAYISFINFWGIFAVTFIVSAAWTLAFESPMIVIERFIFGGLGAKTPKRQPAVHKKVDVENTVPPSSNGAHTPQQEKF